MRVYQQIQISDSADVQNGEVISQISFLAFPLSYINFTLNFNDGSTMSGYVRNDPAWPINYNLYLGLDDQSGSESGAMLPFLGINTYQAVTVGYVVENGTETDWTYYLALIHDKIGWGGDRENGLNPDVAAQGDPILLKELSGRPSDNPVISVDITGGGIFETTIVTTIYEDLFRNEVSHETRGQNFLDWLISVSLKLFDLLVFFFEIFRFFIIDNTMLFFMLMEGGIFAYRLNTAKNVFAAFGAVITDNERLIRGVISFIQLLVGVVWDVVNLLNPLRWIFGK
jgi:hypothetical protein